MRWGRGGERVIEREREKIVVVVVVMVVRHVGW